VTDDPGAPLENTSDAADPSPLPARTEYEGERPHPFQEPTATTARSRFVPLLADLRGATVSRLRPDLVAGVTIAALAVPQGMAYAQTAGLPVVAGLYGLLLPVVAYAALGSSRVLMTGPTATAALMVGPALTIDIVGEPATLDGVDFNLVAKMHMPAGFDPTQDQSSLAYQPQQIHRTNVYEFDAGRQVHLLRSPDDITWVMQTYTNAKAHDLTEEGLATLGDRLALPDGWAYRTVTLDRDFAITTGGVANIVPDDLANMYQGLIDGVGSFDPWA
jgi:hypothetical protein